MNTWTTLKLSALPALILSTLVLGSFGIHAETKQGKQTLLEPEKVHQVTTLEIVDKLQRRHYTKIDLNQTLSADFLSAYIASIDPNRQVFLQSEIDQFQSKYGKSLVSQLQKGQIDPAYEIFNIYQQRLLKVLNEQLSDIDKTIKSFNFEKNDKILIDRSEASWPTTESEINTLFNKRLKSSVLSLRFADKEEAKIIELMTKRYTNQRDRLLKLNSEDVFQTYMNAFTQLYDPHTNYLSPVTSENFDISMSLKLEGIGAMLSSKDEYTKVVRLIHAGPAWKQGELKPSDRITGVAQGDKEIVDVVGWRLDEVVKLIRGPKDSVVRLEVIPAKAVSDDERKIIRITRDEVKLEEQSVQKAMIEVKDDHGVTRKFGVLDVPAFYIDFEALRKRDPNFRSTTKDTAKLLSELVNDGAEGIIIDLRNNGGGSLREANELTSLFIEKGPSVQIRLSDQRTYTEAKKYFSPYYDGPLIVLINRMSASASEIFAGAIQDYKRGVVIGSPSFGKGTVQSLTPMNHGKLKITESKFYRISGESTQHRGVIPDISLPNIYDDTVIGESALDHALAWDSIKPAKYKQFDQVSPYIGSLRDSSKLRADKEPEFIYHRERLAYDESMDLEYLSLNEKERKAFRDQDKKERLAIENRLRKAKGEELLSDFDNDDEDEDENDSSEQEPLNKIDLDDAFLIESANVLLDLKTMQSAPVAVNQK